MKVLHITEALGGGVASYLVDLTREQLNVGVEPTLLFLERAKHAESISQNISFDSQLRTIRVEHKQSRLASYFKFLSTLRRLLRYEHFDILHIHSSIAGLLARMFLPRSMLESALYTPHAWSFSRRDLKPLVAHVYRIVEKTLIHRTAGVLAVSRAEREEGRKLSKRAHVWYVDNGISLTNLGDFKSRQSNQNIRVVSAGRLCPQKDPERFNLLAAAFNPKKVKFEWIGGYMPGDESRYTFDLEFTSVTGWLPRNEVLDRLRNADIFVLLSAWEGMPIALIEAQALGIPALVSAVEGNAEIVLDGKTGFVVEDDQEAKAKLKYLIENTEKRLEFQKNALLKRQYWSISRMESQIREIYLIVKSLNERNAKK